MIKDGKVIDHGYHAWYKGYMFSNDRVSYDRGTVSNLAWVEMLKASPPPGTEEPYMTVVAPTGNEVGISPGGFGRRKTAGIGPVRITRCRRRRASKPWRRALFFRTLPTRR